MGVDEVTRVDVEVDVAVGVIVLTFLVGFSTWEDPRARPRCDMTLADRAVDAR